MSSMSLNVTLAFLIINEFSLFLMGAFMWSFASKNGSLNLDYIQKVRRLFAFKKYRLTILPISLSLIRKEISHLMMMMIDLMV